jgi:hypothetical protein
MLWQSSGGVLPLHALLFFPCRAAFDLLQAYCTYSVQYNGLCLDPCGACQSTQYVPPFFIVFS